MRISIEQLRAILPSLSYARATQLINPLNSTLEEFEINSPVRVAAFISQLAVESRSLTVFEENLNYSAKGLLKTFKKYFTPAQAEKYANKPEKIASRVYANRGGNGNEASGDGWKYRGRGPIQITFPDNYVKYGSSIGLNLLNDPDLVLRPEIGFRLAGSYWKINGLNKLADQEDISGITKKINGGYHGLAERQAFYAKAKKVLAKVDVSTESSVSPDPSSASSAINSSETSEQPVITPETQQADNNEEQSSVEVSSQDLIKIPKVSPSFKSQIVAYWQQLTGLGITVGGIINFAHDHLLLVICVVVGLAIIGMGIWYFNRSMNRAAQQTQKNQDTLANPEKDNVVVVSKGA